MVKDGCFYGTKSPPQVQLNSVTVGSTAQTARLVQLRWGGEPVVADGERDDDILRSRPRRQAAVDTGR